MNNVCCTCLSHFLCCVFYLNLLCNNLLNFQQFCKSICVSVLVINSSLLSFVLMFWQSRDLTVRFHRWLLTKSGRRRHHRLQSRGRWGAPSTIYFRSFDGHCRWGNKVRLYRKQLRNLRRLIATMKPHIRYYICHMSKTFATQIMYFSVSFTNKYLRRCIDPKLYDLPIKSGDGSTCIKARLIKGVDNRATITRGWADFFHASNMKEGEIYAFAFKRSYKRPRLTMHALWA